MKLNLFILPTAIIKGILKQDILMKNFIVPKISDALTQSEFKEMVLAAKKPEEIKNVLGIISNIIENAFEVNDLVDKILVEHKKVVKSGTEESLEIFLKRFGETLKKEGKMNFTNQSKITLNLLMDAYFVSKCNKYLNKKKSIDDFAKYSNIYLNEKQIDEVFSFLESLAKDSKYKNIKFNSKIDDQILTRTILLSQNPLILKLHNSGILKPLSKFMSFFGLIKPKFLNDTIRTNNTNHYINGIFTEFRNLIFGDLEHKKQALYYIVIKCDLLIQNNKNNTMHVNKNLNNLNNYNLNNLNTLKLYAENLLIKVNTLFCTQEKTKKDTQVPTNEFFITNRQNLNSNIKALNSIHSNNYAPSKNDYSI